MTVYVVTQGSYSDYHICGVTLDLNVAKNIAKHLDTDNGWFPAAKIEKYDTDVWDSNNAVWRYYAVSDGREGAVKDTYGEISISEWLNKVKKSKINPHFNVDFYEVYVRAPDMDHALKIGRDLVAEYRARKEGIAE